MKRIMLVLLLCLLSVTGCGDRMTKVKDLRRAGITAMEEGDYQKAAEQFRHAMAYYGTARQEGTELDILRYLSEAEMCSRAFWRRYAHQTQMSCLRLLRQAHLSTAMRESLPRSKVMMWS